MSRHSVWWGVRAISTSHSNQESLRWFWKSPQSSTLSWVVAIVAVRNIIENTPVLRHEDRDSSCSMIVFFSEILMEVVKYNCEWKIAIQHSGLIQTTSLQNIYPSLKSLSPLNIFLIIAYSNLSWSVWFWFLLFLTSGQFVDSCLECFMLSLNTHPASLITKILGLIEINVLLLIGQICSNPDHQFQSAQNAHSSPREHCLGK